MGRIKEALTTAKESLQRMPRNPKALTLVGIALSQLPEGLEKGKVACATTHAQTHTTHARTHARISLSFSLSLSLSLSHTHTHTHTHTYLSPQWPDGTAARVPRGGAFLQCCRSPGLQDPPASLQQPRSHMCVPVPSKGARVHPAVDINRVSPVEPCKIQVLQK